MGGAAVVTAVAAVTYGITGSCTALIGQINTIIVFARLTLSQCESANAATGSDANTAAFVIAVVFDVAAGEAEFI